MIRSKQKPYECPVKSYAKDVIAGKIVAGRLVRLACDRHLRDLKDGKTRGLKFDRSAADHALAFFAFLRLPEGDKPFALTAFQKFIIGSLFGWKGRDGFRRFRTAYIEIGKGNGKSPIAAGIGLYGLEADRELAAEVYSAANTRDQARIMFTDAKNIASASPHLRARFEIGQHNISCLKTNSFFRPVSSEHRGLDGKRVHIGLIDEIHEHRDDSVVQKIARNQGRKQAMIVEITNSGHDRTTICWRHREHSENVLKGLVEDDSWFAFVCGLDPCEKCQAEGKSQPVDECDRCDDWRNEAVWTKANPNLGVSVTHKYLQEQVNEACSMPASANRVKRLNFCIWTEQADRAIPMDQWDGCAARIFADDFSKRECYGALDIGATSDFTAFVLVFPHDDTVTVDIPLDPSNPNAGMRQILRRSFSIFSWFWLPERPIKRDKQTQGVIDVWVEKRIIRTTPGSSVDYDLVLDDILEIVKPFHIGGIAFDRGFQGGQMGTNLMKHFGDLVEQFPQGIVSMNAPFRELLESLPSRRLIHDGNPVLRWMASNVAAEEKSGLMKPSKDHSAEKIDGITALTMGLGLALRAPASVEPRIFWV